MKDLTVGKPMKLILTFALPLLLGNIFQLFYNLADTRIVGETLGADGVSALGATAPINSLVIGFLNGLTNGFALIVARYFGAKDHQLMKKAVAATLVLGVATGAVLTVASLVFINPLLRFLNTPDELFEQAKAYIVILLAGMIISMCYNICAAVLRAVGDTVSPLLFLIISTIVNVGLDFLFILGFKMGVEGAAWATLISQLLSVALCVIYIFKKHPALIPSADSFRLSASIVKTMYATGLSMGMMFSLVSLGTLVMQGTINSFGKDTIASHTASRKISEVFMLPISVFGIATATFSSQNYGAGNMKRVRQGMVSATLLTWIWAVIVITICYLFTPFLVRQVTAITDPEIIALSHKYMKINTPLYFILGMVIMFRNALQAIGSKFIPLASSVVELFGKLLVAKALAPKIGYLGVMVSEPLIWVLMAIVLGVGLFIVLKRQRSLTE